jgi:endonuclease YncB( thermonuclease family)
VRNRRAIIAIACLALACVSLRAQSLTGRVVAIADGDTITVLDVAHAQHKIRLNGIDAPEKTQPFANVSKSHLSDLVFGRDVTVVGKKLDRYGRLVGTVYVGGTNANLEQLRAGLAWFYRQYASDVAPADRPAYEAAEAAARTAHRGLWRDPSPLAPWLFRHPEQAATTQPRALVAGTGPIIGNRNSRIYHAPGCRDYDRVAERNRVYFQTPAEAEAAGYRMAKNCG